jgi:hypothetical protein
MRDGFTHLPYEEWTIRLESDTHGITVEQSVSIDLAVLDMTEGALVQAVRGMLAQVRHTTKSRHAPTTQNKAPS